nr:hypothetical protein [Fervidobacterium sp.]
GGKAIPLQLAEVGVSSPAKMIEETVDEKKGFIENEILKSERIFTVLDNLENVDDDFFFVDDSLNILKFFAAEYDIKKYVRCSTQTVEQRISKLFQFVCQ